MKGQPKPMKMAQYKGNLNGGNSMKMGKAPKSLPKRGMRAAKSRASCGCH